MHSTRAARGSRPVWQQVGRDLSAGCGAGLVCGSSAPAIHPCIGARPKPGRYSRSAMAIRAWGQEGARRATPGWRMARGGRRVGPCLPGAAALLDPGEQPRKHSRSRDRARAIARGGTSVRLSLEMQASRTLVKVVSTIGGKLITAVRELASGQEGRHLFAVQWGHALLSSGHAHLASARRPTVRSHKKSGVRPDLAAAGLHTGPEMLARPRRVLRAPQSNLRTVRNRRCSRQPRWLPRRDDCAE